MANVSKLLHTTVSSETYLINLEADDGLLRAAKAKVREHLRAAFAAASEAFFGMHVSPKFFTQGSFAYRTLNDPAWPPTQQKDLDDGCYLPLGFMRGGRPSKAAEAFFEFVDAALILLAKDERWVFQRKPTCARLIISSDAHIDVPLYAIPDHEFELMQKSMAANRRMTQDGKIRPDTWQALPSDAVLLAHREDDWVPSDPRKIHDWFIDAVDLYGERLRRDCRFLKGWRDHSHLDRYKVTSIFLMVAIWSAYEEIRGPFLPDREDERLLKVVERLPKFVLGKVPNPTCKSEDLNRIADEDRPRVVKALESLAIQLREVIANCANADEAVRQMRAAFGNRIPFRADLVTITASAHAINRVMSEPKRVMPAPEVGRSHSG